MFQTMSDFIGKDPTRNNGILLKSFLVNAIKYHNRAKEYASYITISFYPVLTIDLSFPQLVYGGQQSDERRCILSAGYRRCFHINYKL